jgi:glycosyltransferase involved in cell wall biosynthesis
MDTPLVTVICLCYNHERFVEEAIRSVFEQTYTNIQIIIVDDASTDSSQVIIQRCISGKAGITYLPLRKNRGNCTAFNQGFALAKGEFVIDFATDDIMLPDRIQQQVDFFSTLSTEYGVVFTNALYVDANGKEIRNHYQYLFKKGLLSRIPQGDVYRELLSVYFISSPTMMVRKKVLDVLSGYDEMLSYEDFDFWVRSSRDYKYGYLDAVTTKVRITTRSMSRGWYVRGDKQLYSTYLVCKKAMLLNRSKQDENALAKRLKYEVRQSVFSENHAEAKLFYDLLKEMKRTNTTYRLLIIFSKLKLPLAPLRKLYHHIRYGA